MRLVTGSPRLRGEAQRWGGMRGRACNLCARGSGEGGCLEGGRARRKDEGKVFKIMVY